MNENIGNTIIHILAIIGYIDVIIYFGERLSGIAYELGRLTARFILFLIYL